MKNLLVVFMLMCTACGSHTIDEGTKDSINAIEDHPLLDTSVSRIPDGYAPPNADIDTSKRIKDSIKASDSAKELN